MATAILLIVSLAFVSMATGSTRVPKARSLLFQANPGGDPTTVIGRLDFLEWNGEVTIVGALSGLSPGFHGLHIHEFGDLGDGCNAAGVHFNPFGTNHGGPQDSPAERHVGDLGNIMTPTSGPTTVIIHDSIVTFTGNRGIIGRAVVVHNNTDDLGQGGNEESRRTGNAGRRVACGVIGYIMPEFA